MVAATRGVIAMKRVEAILAASTLLGMAVEVGRLLSPPSPRLQLLFEGVINSPTLSSACTG